jgi:hypothetical protein
MEEELEKLYQDLFVNRQIYRGQGLVTTTIPTGSDSIISGGSIGMDFASLYPGVQKRYYRIKQMIRKNKIQRMFQNPS